MRGRKGDKKHKGIEKGRAAAAEKGKRRGQEQLDAVRRSNLPILLRWERIRAQDDYQDDWKRHWELGRECGKYRSGGMFPLKDADSERFQQTARECERHDDMMLKKYGLQWVANPTQVEKNETWRCAEPPPGVTFDDMPKIERIHIEKIFEQLRVYYGRTVGLPFWSSSPKEMSIWKALSRGRKVSQQKRIQQVDALKKMFSTIFEKIHGRKYDAVDFRRIASSTVDWVSPCFVCPEWGKCQRKSCPELEAQLKARRVETPQAELLVAPETMAIMLDRYVVGEQPTLPENDTFATEETEDYT